MTGVSSQAWAVAYSVDCLYLAQPFPKFTLPIQSAHCTQRHRLTLESLLNGSCPFKRLLVCIAVVPDPPYYSLAVISLVIYKCLPLKLPIVKFSASGSVQITS